MPEPLMLKIITDADDTGVRKIDKGMGDLHVSSRRASAAINSFSREIMQAKSGADLASASAESLAHIFHQGIAGAVIIGGVKLVSDQIKAMGELVRGVGEETATATRQLERMGEPGNLADAVKAADLLSNNLENVTKKLEAIKSGNFFSRFLADATGATKELEAQAATLQKMKDSELALGFLKEQQKAQKSVGATDEQKSIDSINEKYQERLKLVDQIKSEGDKATAKSAIDEIKQAELSDLQLKFEEKLKTAKQKTADTQEGIVKASQNRRILEGTNAEMALTTGGTLRGKGQRATSFEVGMAKQLERTQLSAKQNVAQGVLMKRARELGVTGTSLSGTEIITDLNKVKNSLLEDATAAKYEAEARKYSTAEAIKAEKQATEAHSKASKEAQDLTDAQSNLKEEINKTTQGQPAPNLQGQSTAQMLGNIYSVLTSALTELKSYAHAS
jgi:hypothetical protein